MIEYKKCVAYEGVSIKMLGENIDLIEYPKRVENINCLTHAVGAVMSVGALALCIIKTIVADSKTLLSAVIYCVSLIVLYTASAVYHGLPSGKLKKAARVIDHSMVFILIAGTATPCALVSLYDKSPRFGLAVFLIGWISAALGVAAKIFFFKKARVISTVLYMSECFAMLCCAFPFREGFDGNAFFLLLVGCGVYLVGSLLLALGQKKPALHAAFHVFVMLASAIHFYVIYSYTLIN